MISQLRIPDLETSKRLIANVRQARLELQEVNQKLDEINQLLAQDLEKQWSMSWSKRRSSVGRDT